MTDSSNSTNPFGFPPWRVVHPQTQEREKLFRILRSSWSHRMTGPPPIPQRKRLASEMASLLNETAVLPALTAASKVTFAT